MARASGFTLIELLVVMAIMSVSLGIVGPLLATQVDKSKAIAEFNTAEAYMLHSSKVAFLRGQNIRFVLDGKQLTRFIEGKPQKVDYDYLFFPRQEFHINANGFFSQPSVVVHIRQRQDEIILSSGQS